MISRLVDPQDWPCQPKFIPLVAAFIASSRFASSHTINGFLPPSSRLTCLTADSAAAFWIAIPDATEPINAIRFTRGSLTNTSPVVRSPVTILITPGGATSAHISASKLADSGACSDGFTTIVFPAINAGAIRDAANPIGWLNGMIRPTTPYGSLRVRWIFSGVEGTVIPLSS